MKARRKQVMMMAGGGLTHVSGGVGTFIRYLTDEWATKPGAPQVRVVDTRGEGGKASMGLHFLKAVCLVLLVRGSIRRIDLLHIHMSAYGSALTQGRADTDRGPPQHSSDRAYARLQFLQILCQSTGARRKALRLALNRARACHRAG